MRIFYLFIFGFNLLSPLAFSESHRELSVLPANRAVEDHQVVRDSGYLYSKELLTDGVRTTTRSSVSSITTHKHFSEFVDKKSCNSNNEALLIIAFGTDNSKKAATGCQEHIDGKVVRLDSETKTLLCKYSCKTLTLDSLQALYFESFVRFIEPNISRKLN